MTVAPSFWRGLLVALPVAFGFWLLVAVGVAHAQEVEIGSAIAGALR